jgi:putative protease
MGEWNTGYGSSATKRKIYLGKVTNYFSNLKVVEIKVENGTLKKDDKILITGPTTGIYEYDVQEIRVDLKETGEALKGELCSIKVDDLLRRSDKVYKWVDESEVKNQ